MKSTARFSVDPRLSALLGESYTSSEHALRELVDNAWDVEARVVKITLPDILSEKPVVIEDDGHGHEEPGSPAGIPQDCQPPLQPEGRTHAEFGSESESSETIELTASGGDVIESDKGLQKLTESIQEDVKASLTEIHGKEVALAKGRWTQMMKRRLEAVPEHRRAIAEEKLERLISRSYQEGEKEERITILINLVLDALEMDEYWTVCREIEEAEKSDVFIFANALDKFGLSDLAFIAHQADRRRAFLDGLDDLAKDPKTTEAQMHTALQHNLWIFGNEYSLMSSNRQLQTIVRDFNDKIYRDKDAADRADLLLAANVENRHLLIEFKRPAIPVGRDAEHQAVTYADTLTGQIGVDLDILVVGGSVDPKLQPTYSGKKTRFLSYRAVIANARTQLECLIKQHRSRSQSRYAGHHQAGGQGVSLDFSIDLPSIYPKTEPYSR